jgi:predicted dehydrogenase
MNTVSEYRVGVLGCGLISADHLAAWAQCQGARVVAVCDPRLDRAQARADQFQIASCYQSPQAMIEAEALDIVDIVTPRETHADMVRLAAHHGIHAISEKPLCPSYAEAEMLVREVGTTVRVMVNENWRYRAYFRKIAEWLEAGRLGTIVQARISLWRSNMLPRDDGLITSLTRQPFLAREERVLIAESLIHELDVARALFGEMEVVACTTARASGHIVGEDSATILLRTDYGLSIVVDGTMTAAGTAPRAPDRVEIAGTRCSVLLEDGVLTLRGAEEETHRYDEDAVRQGCFNASIQHFVDQLRSGGPLWTSAKDQLGTLRLVENAYEMAESPPALGEMRLPPIAPPRITGHGG